MAMKALLHPPNKSLLYSIYELNWKHPRKNNKSFNKLTEASKKLQLNCTSRTHIYTSWQGPRAAAGDALLLLLLLLKSQSETE